MMYLGKAYNARPVVGWGVPLAVWVGALLLLRAAIER